VNPSQTDIVLTLKILIQQMNQLELASLGKYKCRIEKCEKCEKCD
jgi:hypothetical protein